MKDLIEFVGCVFVYIGFPVLLYLYAVGFGVI